MDAARNRSEGTSDDQMDDPGRPVDVEQLARSVLEASSQQRVSRVGTPRPAPVLTRRALQDPTTLDSLPVPIVEAVVFFLAALDAQTHPPLVKELVVRALRACSGASREVRTVTPHQ